MAKIARMISALEVKDTAPIFSSVDEEVVSVRRENAQLKERLMALETQVAWFKKQLFGPKSEKRPVENPQQFSLLSEAAPPTPAEGEMRTITYQRGTACKTRSEECVNEAGLRFTSDVPVKVIQSTLPELTGPEADQYEIIGTKTTYRLAQRPASYVILQYERPVIKRKASETPMPSPAPLNVLDRSVADVSFLVGMLVDKFQYHLPLYRQHQRLQQAGVTLSRATLTQQVKRAIELLRPITDAMLDHVLLSRTLAMDETPIKASRQAPGKLKQGYFWPIYGEDDEVIFTYSDSRGRQHIEKILQQRFKGTLLSDGYAAYARYVQQSEGVKHAQCWTHTRRQFIEAEALAPDATAHALALIGQLYRIEAEITAPSLTAEKKREARLLYSKPVVDQLFEWCDTQLRRPELFPSHPFTKALKYTLNREAGLRLFLEEPDVPLDTNHLERALRAIPMGRKNWLFCWTELGAEHVGIIQSLITTCKLHGVHPYTYLTDVLLRINHHPASQVLDLTPRVWKEKFANNPLRSDLYDRVNDVLE